MAAVIGEVSAIISVVELGLSLASALNTYVSSISAAQDDVFGLSNEIEATLSNLRGLEGLIKKNEESKAWDNDGLELAKRCIGDCERIIKKLRRLLQKANWRDKEGVETKVVVKNEIDLTKFEKALWPRLKPELEVCRGELQRVKLNIILANNSYMIGTVSTEAEKKKYREAIQSLSQARKLNAKKIRKIRDRRRRPDSVADVIGRSSIPGYPYAENEFELELQEAFEKFLEIEAEKEVEEDRILLLTEETKKKEAEEEKKKKIEQKAIKEYVGKVKKIEAEMQGKRDALRKKLEKRPGLTQQQIEFIIEDVHPTNHNHAALLMRDAQILEEQPSETATLKNIQTISGPPPKVSRSGSFRKLFRNSSKKQVESSVPTSGTLPSAWRDPATKTGFAKLESWYISEETSWQNGRRTPAPLPHSWMIKALMEAENSRSQVAPTPETFKPVWKVLLSLSAELIGQINGLVEERQHRKPQYDWSIVLIDLPNNDEKRKSVRIGPFRFHFDDDNERVYVDGIYVILKYEEKSAESGKLNKENERPRNRSPDSFSSEGTLPQRRRSSSPTRDREHQQSIARRMSSLSRRSHVGQSPTAYPGVNSRQPSYLSTQNRVSFDEVRKPSGESYYDNRYQEPDAGEGLEVPEKWRPAPHRHYERFDRNEDFRFPPQREYDFVLGGGGRSRSSPYSRPPPPPPPPPAPVYTNPGIVQPSPGIARPEGAYTAHASTSTYQKAPIIIYDESPRYMETFARKETPRRDSYDLENDRNARMNALVRREASQWRQYSASPERPRVVDHDYDEIDYYDRIPTSPGSKRIDSTQRRSSLKRESLYYDTRLNSDSDDIDGRRRYGMRRETDDIDGQRRYGMRSREKRETRSGYFTPLSPRSRDLRASVTDEDDEDEWVSSEKEIVDRLVAKHTRPLAKSASTADEGAMKNGNQVNEEELSRHLQSTALSDITEDDENVSSANSEEAKAAK